jgi:YD repeat-containing protein
MTKKVLNNLKLRFVLLMTGACLIFIPGFSQSVPYPAAPLDQSFIPPSPNAQGFQTYGNTPMALYEGLPAISIPIYEVKCGSLSVPISLSYNYAGLQPLEDASWVGLGWNLNVGGVITRIPEGNIDGSEYAGYNYGEYSIVDSLQPANNTFLGLAYNNFSYTSYDLALDVFDCELNGISGKFFWYKGKAYMMSYNKDLAVSWPSPSSNITVTTKDGVICTFGAQESTTSNQSWQGHKIVRTYASAWFLTSMISPDKKDTILFNYANYSWQQAQIPYLYSYVMSNAVGQSDLGASTDFLMTPTIQTKILQSISCRNVTVNFVPDPQLRTDVLGNSPKLEEIDVIDNLTGTVVRKNAFTYDYFIGQNGSNFDTTASGKRLYLKTFQVVNPTASSDTQAYKFKYGACCAFPEKGTTGTDYWGFYNGADLNTDGLPPPSLGFYNPAPPVNFTFPVGSRSPNFDACSEGAMDTLFYPTGGFTVFQYELNNYKDASHASADGPGIRINSIKDYTSGIDFPATQRYYTYLADDGSSSSGRMTNFPNFSGPSFSANSNSYTAYIASNNGAGVGGTNPGFYYTKVTEMTSSGSEVHKTDYYFNNFSTSLFADVRPTTEVDYLYGPATGSFKPLKVTTNTYGGAQDTSFLFGTPYMQSYTFTTNCNTCIPIYTYGYTSGYARAQWINIASSQVKEYDAAGDSMTTTTTFNYNSVRNVSSIQQTLADGNSIVKIFKYPEDYTSSLTGNMITNRVLSPVIEQQTWYQSPGGGTSGLIAGQVTSYDQNIFRPVGVYNVETTSPLYSLNNQTTSGGLYNTLLPDSRYLLHQSIFYDSNNNVKQYNKTNDISTCILWNYIHSLPVAQVMNATADQVAYTSFEADGTGSWNILSLSRDTTTSITGRSSYNLSNGSISRTSLTSSNNYVVSYWSRNGSYNVSGSTSTVTGKTVNGWTYYEHAVSGTTSVTISGTGSIDELRLYPKDAQMSTTTYQPLVGKTSECDAGNRIQYYIYDGFGRLKVVKDQDGNIIKTTDYHYRAQ